LKKFLSVDSTSCAARDVRLALRSARKHRWRLNSSSIVLLRLRMTVLFLTRFQAFREFKRGGDFRLDADENGAKVFQSLLLS